MSAARRRRLLAPAPPAVSVQQLRTPVGVLDVAASSRSLLYVGLGRERGDAPFDRWLRNRFAGSEATPVLTAALQQLREYFAGERKRFDIDVDPGGTDFQRRVWAALLKIPFGQTISYGELSRRVGGAARSIGGAVGANPLPIVIPCHRVIGTDGSLTGYGGGLRMKVWLLRHEGALLT